MDSSYKVGDKTVIEYGSFYGICSKCKEFEEIFNTINGKNVCPNCLENIKAGEQN